MTLEELLDLFDQHSDLYLKTEGIKDERKLHPRRDLHAFLLLDKLHEGDGKNLNAVASAGHEEIWLQVAPEEIAANAVEEDITDLIRCGVRYDRSYSCFAMFV